QPSSTTRRSADIRNLNLAKGNYRPDGQILRTSNHRPINRKRKLLLNGLTINLPRRNDRKDRIAREITGIHTIKNLHQIKPAHLNRRVIPNIGVRHGDLLAL